MGKQAMKLELTWINRVLRLKDTQLCTLIISILSN